jgi:6-phosphogluconate dehydrogenase
MCEDLEMRVHHPREFSQIASHYTVQIPNFITIPLFTTLLGAKIDSWRKVVASCALVTIPVQPFGSTLNYFDAHARVGQPANAIHGFRNFFGAPAFEHADNLDGFYTI